MSTLKLDEAQTLLQPQKDDFESRNEDIRQDIHACFKQLNSFDIMKSALTIFTSNTKLMLLMMFSIIPFFVFMVFFEIKLQRVIVMTPSVLRNPYWITVTPYDSRGNESRSVDDHDENKHMKLVFDVLQLCLLYLVVYPLLELLSMATTIQIAAQVHGGERPSTLEEVFYRINNLKGVLFACGYVHFLSFLSLFAISWIVLIHFIFTGELSFDDFWPLDIGNCLGILVIGIHTMFFVAVLYKYVDWTASWNMIMVISVLEDESGSDLDAFQMTTYYGVHCKPTGFYLMLGFMGFSSVLRLACLYLYGGIINLSVVGVTSVVIGFVCLGNLIKWVAFVLYYFDCKHQTTEKKDGEEIGKAMNV